MLKQLLKISLGDLLGVDIGEDELGHLHEEARVVLQLLEGLCLRHLLEVLYKVVLAELLELVCLVAVRVDEEVANVVIVNIVHQSVLAKVLESLEHVLIGKTEQVQGDLW